MSTAAAGGYEGGAGGKFRKRPFRKQATPYDRPVSALRNPVEGGNNNGWLSKIVDPASRIITRSAQIFFSSVFRKRLTAAETVSEADRKLSNEPSEAVSASQNPFGVQEPVVNGSDDLNNHSDNSGVGELEQILKQKTFTRAEIDRLTELLRSRTVDIPAEDEKKRSEPSTLQPVAYNHKVELANVPVQENGVDSRRLLGEASTPAVSSRILEEDIASPAELAKAYMGNRTSKVSPSTLGLHSLREELPLPSNVPFPRKSSGMSLVPRSSVRSAGIPGVSENGYQTPRSRGRSAIYSMARTPYSRIHLTAKGIGDTDDWYAGPSTSPWTLDNNMVSTGKQVSKRRSLVLDNDIGSVGPIRRIRQKTNLMSPKSIGSLAPETHIPTRGTAFGSDVAQGSVSLTQKPLLLEEHRHRSLKMRIAENGSNCIPSTSFASVPSQSSEMAQKILQQLDKLVPSPKEKSSELKLATAGEKSCAKLSLSMLHGQAFRRVEEVDSSKFLNNIQGTCTLDAVGGTPLPVIQDSAYRKLDKVEENGWLKIAASGNKLAPEANGTERNTLNKDTVPIFRTADSAISNSVVTPPQKKQAYQMNAHKESLELDDNCCGTKGVHSVNGKEKLDNSTVEENKAVAAKTVTVEKPPVSEINTPASLILNKSSGTGASDGPRVNQKNPGFGAPLTSVSSTVTQPAPLCQSPPLFGNVVPTKGPASSPVFNFGSKVIGNAPPFTFSSVSSFSESSGLKFDARSGSVLGTSSSPATIGATSTGIITKAALSDTGGKENAPKTGDLFRKHENATFSSVSTSPTPFSFSNSMKNSNLSNGSVAPSTLLFSVPAPSVPASTISSNMSFMSGSATTAITTTGSLSASAASPAFSSVPIFQFGSGTTMAVAPSSVSQPSTSGAESTDLEQKVETAPPFASVSPLPFGTTSSPLTSTGSGIFGLSNVTPASTTNSSSSANHLSSNPFGAGTGPVFGLQTASGTVTSSFTQSIPSQLGLSAASPTFGLSASSTFSSGSSLFGSSTSASKLFSSGSGFGQNSLTTFSTGANHFSTASLFSSSSPPESSVINSAFSSASSPASGFSFGGSSTAGAASGSASSPATGFSFGGSSTASAATGSASPSTGFSFGGSSTAGATTVIASPATTGFSFGGSSTAGAATGSVLMGFGSGIGASSGSVFSFTSASAATSSASLTSSQPVFGVPNPSITFGSSCPANDQMNMEDSMAEDTVQASTPAVPTFGQPATTPSPGFMFTSAPSGAPFQFGAQQNPATPQNSSPFQATSGNFDFAPGGSFSLGTADKSNRRIFRAKRDKTRKK
ncbi:nuclear pore complex protein NUP1-like isoform X2 [Telopea speciosissima]|uniref:nuclear pore complex protein NUP1-like isoform X2 n=1 Tax=Telopea speciosissima TaxID=54955 RepID=UPI001CC3E8CA|nr:nuclear pore complex protein NUP1-like isoform X2 [Telopea speciosissima]